MARLLLLAASHPFWEWIGPLLVIDALASQFVRYALKERRQMGGVRHRVEKS